MLLLGQLAEVLHFEVAQPLFLIAELLGRVGLFTKEVGCGCGLDRSGLEILFNDRLVSLVVTSCCRLSMMASKRVRDRTSPAVTPSTRLISVMVVGVT